jgi:hypothetical protein
MLDTMRFSTYSLQKQNGRRTFWHLSGSTSTAAGAWMDWDERSLKNFFMVSADQFFLTRKKAIFEFMLVPQQ